jgi:hypothetical protein
VTLALPRSVEWYSSSHDHRERNSLIGGPNACQTCKQFGDKLKTVACNTLLTIDKDAIKNRPP